MHQHSHSHTSSIESRQKSASALKKTLVLIIIFILVEFISGRIANSLALMTDALHMFSDAGAVLLSLFAFWLAKKPSSLKWSFGYYRAEVIGALFSGFSTIALAIFLIYEAIHRLIHPEPVNGPIVFFVALVAVIINLVMILLLHKDQKGNINVKGAYIHILGDLIGSAGVLIAGILLWITKWDPIDPIITLLFSILVLWTAKSVIKETLRILMEGTPANIDSKAVMQDLSALKSVNNVHHLHIWTLSSGLLAMSCHIISEVPTKALEEAEALIRTKYHIVHTTIQTEEEGGKGYESCTIC